MMEAVAVVIICAWLVWPLALEVWDTIKERR